jgi:hypothetical protein
MSDYIVSQSDKATIIVSSTQGPIGPQGPPGVDVSLQFTSNGTLTEQVIDRFSYTNYGGAKYVIYATVGSVRQICEILLLHNSTTVSFVEYANINTASSLCVFNANILEGNVQLLMTPVSINTNFRIVRNLLPT